MVPAARHWTQASGVPAADAGAGREERRLEFASCNLCVRERAEGSGRAGLTRASKKKSARAAKKSRSYTPLTYYANGIVYEAVDFEWDDSKDLRNQRKHGLSSSDARRLFESEAEVLEIFDAEHSDLEDRFIAIGPIDRGWWSSSTRNPRKMSSASLVPDWPTSASRRCTARRWIESNDGHSRTD